VQFSFQSRKVKAYKVHAGFKSIPGGLSLYDLALVFPKTPFDIVPNKVKPISLPKVQGVNPPGNKATPR
jgi:hypothetical protein